MTSGIPVYNLLLCMFGIILCTSVLSFVDFSYCIYVGLAHAKM
jgi:hypothetical protein